MYVRSGQASNTVLSLVLKQEGTTYQTSVMFETNALASDNLDQKMDMRYLETGIEAAPRLYMLCSDAPVRKNVIKDDFRNKSFELESKFKAAGYYTFSLDNTVIAEDYSAVLLFDKLTNEFIDLKQEATYTFYTEAYEGNRFTIIFTNQPESHATPISLAIEDGSNDSVEITQMGHTFNIEMSDAHAADCMISVYTLLGQEAIYTSNLSVVDGSNLVTLPAELTGVHLLVVRYGETVITKKVVL
jgi:hypothetical protein